MEVIAKLNWLRIAPRKVRLVADLIRKKPVEEALILLTFTAKKAAQPLMKLLKSAIANAENNFQLDSSSLYISQLKVDEGPRLKRGRPRARGMIGPIEKKISHVTLVLKGEKRKQEKREIEIKEKEKLKKEPKKKTKRKFEVLKQNFLEEKQKKGLKRIFKRKAF